MSKSKYSHNCCGDDAEAPLDSNAPKCKSPDNSAIDIVELTNSVKTEFEKIIQTRNLKKSRTQSTAPYVEYTEEELIYIPCWIHNVRQSLHDHSYEEFGEYAQEVVDNINSQLEGSFAYGNSAGAKYDDTHGVECRLRLKIPQKVPKSWLNPLFKENRRISHWWQDITWNGSSYDEDPHPDGYGVNNTVKKSDPNLEYISNANGATNYWNEVGEDYNFKNYYSIPVLNEGNERDEYFWGGSYGVLFNWLSLFNGNTGHNPNTFANISNYYDGQYFANGTTFEREIKGPNVHPDYIALTPIGIGPSGEDTYTTTFEGCGHLAPMIARFPGINLVFTDAAGGVASFPQRTIGSWAPAGTATFGPSAGDITSGHEVGHALGLQHVFSGAPHHGETRLSFVSPLYDGLNKIKFFKNTTNYFIPPFEYISEDFEDYTTVKNFETIEENEKIYVENVINDGVRLATRYFGGKMEFDKGTPELPLSVTNTYLNFEGDEEALDVAEFFAILPRIPSFWGGSYIENSDGSKSMVVNPSEIDNTRSLRNSSIPNLNTLSGSNLPQLGETFDSQFYIYKVTYGFEGLSLYATVHFIKKAVGTNTTSAQALSATSPQTNLATDGNKAIKQHEIWAENYQEQCVDSDSTSPFAMDVFFDSNASIEDYIYIGSPSEYNEAKQVLMDPVNGMVNFLGNGDISYSTYNSIMAQNDMNEYVWTSYSTSAKKARVISMHSNVSIENNSSDIMWYYADGNDQIGWISHPSLLPNSVNSIIRTQPLRRKKYRVLESYHLSALEAQGIGFPEYVDVETIEGRKGPNVTTYIPFCKIQEVIDETTGEGTGEYLQTDEFDPFWYINFNWLNPRFPKYPENWPVSKLYDATDNDGNPLCPCLYTSQHYYYEKIGEPIIVDGVQEAPVTMHLAEYIPINAKTEDLVFNNGSNVVDSDGVNGPYGPWNTYGEEPQDNGTDAYKLYMLYMYLDYKVNLDIESNDYGNLMTSVHDDETGNYFNVEHFFGVQKSSTLCGNQKVHGAFMEVYTNTLEFKNHYPAVRRYGARIHSFPHGRGVFFENHILDNQCNDCEEPNIEIPYWAYTGMFGQGAVPLPLKLNTDSFTTNPDLATSAGPSSFSHPLFQVWSLDIDGVTDTGRDTAWTPQYQYSSFEGKASRSDIYLYGLGKHDCMATGHYQDNSIWFSPSIVLKFAFGNTDPNGAMYNPFRDPNATTDDIHKFFKRENASQRNLAGQKSLGLNLEIGAFRNIMHYDTGTKMKGYELNSDNFLRPSEPTGYIPGGSQSVFSPDQIAKIEAVVETRYSIYNRAMLFADEIDLRNTAYSSTSEVNSFFQTAKQNIINILENEIEVAEGEATIIGDYNQLLVAGTSITVIEKCFSQDINICNSDYNTAEMQDLYSNIDSNILLPTEPYSYGPVFMVNGENKVYLYNPNLCCQGSWSLEHSTCVQGLSTMAALDCGNCEGTRSIKKETVKHEVYSSVGLNLVAEKNPSEIYTGKVIIHNGSYYSFSSTQTKSIKLVYNRSQNEINNIYEKFKKYSGIINKMSNFAR